MIPSFVIAGTGSGCGKTTMALGIMAALTKRGHRVQPFKVGPDFIDPGYHTRITGRISRNLDSWILTRKANLEIFSRASQGADIAVVEGVMGLFDGKDGLSPEGSTAQIASWLELPVLLVMDAKGMGRSAAALIKGLVNFDPQLTIKWVVFNRIGGKRHLVLLREAIAGTISEVTVLGGLPRRPDVSIPERHLGLVTAEDHGIVQADALASLVEEFVDLDALIRACGAKGPGGCACGEGRIRDALPCEPLGTDTPEEGAPPCVSPPRRPSLCHGRHTSPNPSQKIRIAVAWDKAFCFYYEDNLELLRENWAELVLFSPLSDPLLPPGISGIYIGGGYPELHAEALSVNTSIANEIRTCSLSGMPIFAECGGYMYLCSAIGMASGASYSMAGVFPFQTRMLPRFSVLGYREVTLIKDSVLGPKGTIIRGHEFHYSELVASSGKDPATPALFYARDSCGRDLGPAGHIVKNTASSYVHLHFRSNPAVPAHFVCECRKFRKENADQRPCPA